jgi:lysophospholipase L1-like esterase
MPSEAAFKADTQTSINNFHSKWPSAKIYFMQIWERNYASQCNTLDGWYADVVTANPGVCYLGPDERLFLENGDNGATYTADGTHPNSAGYLLTAQQWKTTLGI